MISITRISWGDLGIAYTVFSFRTFRPGNYTSRFSFRTFPLSCPISLSKAFFQQTDISYFPGTESFILNCITSLNFVAIYGKWEWVMLISKQWTQTGFSMSKFGFFWPLSSEFTRARGKLNLISILRLFTCRCMSPQTQLSPFYIFFQKHIITK